MKLGILAAVAALAMSSPVVAGDWRYGGSNDDTMKGFDIDSLTINGDKRTVWEIMVFKTTNEYGVDYYLSRIEYDCIGSRYRDLAVASYVLSGSSGTTLPATMQWTNIFPDTIGETSFNTVCGLEAAESLDISTSYGFAEVARSVLTASD